MGYLLPVLVEIHLRNTNAFVHSHGKDHKLCVWMFHSRDEPFLNKTLPLDTARPGTPGKQPKLVYSLPVNALNFCAFSILFLDDLDDVGTSDPKSHEFGTQEKGPTIGHTPEQSKDFGGRKGISEPLGRHETCKGAEQSDEAKRNTQPRDEGDETSDIEYSPSRGLIAVPNTFNTGAIDIFHVPLKRRVSTIRADSFTQTGMLMAVSIFVSNAGHLQVASAFENGHVMLFVCRDNFRDEDAIQKTDFTTTSWTWDRIYSHVSHKHPALSIDLAPSRTYFISSAADGALVKHPVPEPNPTGYSIPDNAKHSPLVIEKTGQSGQQSLHIRSDELFFATACWDHAVRLYHCNTLHLMTVLRWRKDGCTVIAFADVALNPTRSAKSQAYESDTGSFHRLENTLGGLLRQRAGKVHKTHWLAVGTKKGQICLWDVY